MGHKRRGKQEKGIVNDKLMGFYKGKRVAVLGGAGFVGVQLVHQLVLAGASQILVIDNFSRGRNIVRGRRIAYLPADAGEPAQYASWLAGMDVVFNLAAQVAGVLYNQKNHDEMYTKNVRLLRGAVQASEQAGVARYLCCSSVCVYAEEYQSPCIEKNGFMGEPNPANWGYAMSKRTGEVIAKESDIGHVVIVRPSNIIGPHDYYDERAHVVPAFVKRSIETDGIFHAYGSPHIQREFIYSEDVALGMMHAAAFGDDREAYNVGCNGENVISMLGLAGKINWLVALKIEDKDPIRQIVFDIYRGGGDSKRYSNAEKLLALGWSHKWKITNALEIVVDDYLRRFDGQDLR